MSLFLYHKNYKIILWTIKEKHIDSLSFINLLSLKSSDDFSVVVSASQVKYNTV